jgi:DUF1365 family protein
MNSCLYECTIIHDRHSPKRYRFVHKIFMFYFDLDELPQLSHASCLLGYNQPRVFDFKDQDHITSGFLSIKENIRAYLKTQGVGADIHRIQLLTNVRTFGYIFNPVSFYFCFDLNGAPVCVVSEIGNTFGELKYFYLGPDKKNTKAFSGRQVKYYYISPFTDLDNQLDFRIQVPDDRLNITIDTLKNGEKFFWSSMTGPRRPLTSANLLWYSIKYPWVTLKVIFLIHWHAAMLHFVKGVAHHAKEDNPSLQKEVHRAWTKK